MNAELLKMSADLRLPLLATNDAHYLEACDHAHHDALLCIGTAANLDDPSRFKFDGQGFYVKTGEEMLEVFHDHPQAVHNTMEIAERCDDLTPMGTYHIPEFEVPRGAPRARAREGAWDGVRGGSRLAPDEPLAKRRPRRRAPRARRMR